MLGNWYRRAAAGAAATAAAIVISLAMGADPAAGPLEQTGPAGTSTFLIDDFSSSEGKSPLGTSWVAVPASGGRRAPVGNMKLEEYEQRTCLHLVRAAVVGRTDSPLVEARLYLHPERRSFDARAYRGIRLTVKGNGQPTAVRLQTKDTRLAGQYYQAEFRAASQWQQIELPFLAFASAAVRQSFDPASLRSMTIAASGAGTGADVYIDKIEFFKGQEMYRKLTPQEERVILHKGTEAPFTGKYNEHFEKGVYTCRRCGAELFESSDKFKSECGWPSFDEQIPGRVKWQPDADGVRTEIICNNCGAHLGHVFLGEGYTPKNTRYCVNSISMDFISAEERARKAAEAQQNVSSATATNPQSAIPNPQSQARALFASGCFWGTEYHFQRAPGVISTTVGYTGGRTENPTYKQVSTGKTGHAETTEVIYDPMKISYEQLARLFFETHDFTQLNRQGPDIGTQYRSAIFYLNDEQKQVAERLVATLRQKGFDVKTQVTPAGKFWPAEDYHQDYYNKTQGTPYCHIYRKIF